MNAGTIFEGILRVIFGIFYVLVVLPISWIGKGLKIVFVDVCKSMYAKVIGAIAGIILIALIGSAL